MYFLTQNKKMIFLTIKATQIKLRYIYLLLFNQLPTKAF